MINEKPPATPKAPQETPRTPVLQEIFYPIPQQPSPTIRATQAPPTPHVLEHQPVPNLSKEATGNKALPLPEMPGMTKELEAALKGFQKPEGVSCASETATNCAAPNKSGAIER